MFCQDVQVLWTGVAHRRRAYLIIALLVAALVGGCATSRDTAAPATWNAGAPTGGPGTPGPGATTGQPTPTGQPSSSTGPTRYAFPVQGRNVSYHRTHAGYPGTDIFAACGVAVVAVTDGTVLEVSRVDRFSRSGPLGPYNGGLFVSLLGDDGVRYYGSHLVEVADGIDAGVRVRAGQRVGKVGHTGNASNVCHLHFGISPRCQGKDDWWIRRGVIWPAPYLDAWRRNVAKSPVKSVADWQHRHGCPKAPR